MKVINTYIVSADAVHRYSGYFIPVQDRNEWCELYQCRNDFYYVRVSGSISKLDKESFQNILAHDAPNTVD
jgi:hypothetical protein